MPLTVPQSNLAREESMSRETTILVVCAWCNKPVGRKQGHGVSGVSHTICPNCLPSVLEDFGKSKMGQSPECSSENVKV